VNVLAFAGVAALLTLTPGPDSLLVLRTALVAGRRAALVAGLGVCTACMWWGCAAAFGLTALLAGSRDLYTAVRWAGAAYLVYLGVRMLADTRHAPKAAGSTGSVRAGSVDSGATAETSAGVGSGGVRPVRGWFLRGMLTNALNPKIGVFYLSLLPQFIPAGGSVLAYSLGLTSIHAVEGLVWFTVVITLADRLGGLLRTPVIRRGLDRIAGLAFLGFAARLMLRP
jgi:threonine/homoserine/homoserine lactone efflux protein